MNDRRSDIPTILTAGSIASGVGRALRLGIHACARAQGWRLIYQNGDMHFLERWIGDWRPMATLVYLCSPHVVSRAMAMTPTVAAIANVRGLAVPAIDVDETAVGHAAADHLLASRVASFAAFGNWTIHWAADRCQAFESAVGKAGYECHRSPNNVLQERLVDSVTASRERTLRWIKSLPKPVGIFAACDRWGQVLSNICHAAGVRIPEDARIVGVDNDEMVCETTEPPLSSIAVNWRQIGYDAAMMTGQLALGRRVEKRLQLIRPAGIVVRQSSDLLAVPDPEVAAALSIIRQHADRMFSVGELLRRLPVDRRRLEKRFREQVGRRILQEVRRVHVEHAKRLLVSTDLSMPQIAGHCGFGSATKFGVAFKQETGQTPTAFRRQFRLHG